MKDKFSRNINYLRLSITDRCNLRCRYCMPHGIELVDMNELLTYEEITEIVKAAVTCGITRLKITGGEPLIRRGAAGLIRALKDLPGVEQVTMTTNGTLLGGHVHELKQSGLDAVNISLDTLRPERFEAITGFDLLGIVRQSIDAAISAGLQTKINVVLLDGINSDEWDDLLCLAKNCPVYVRFIELMPISEGKNFQPVSNSRLLAAISEKYHHLEADSRSHGNGPAKYFKLPGFLGGVGFISALCGNFCGTCNRLRLTSRGKLKPCLCYSDAVDLRQIVRKGGNKHEDLISAIRQAVSMKPQGHCFGDAEKVSESQRMAEIGG